MNKIEKVNSFICDRLINISFKDYQNILLENGYDEDDRGTQYKKLISYCKAQKLSKYQLKNKYVYGKNDKEKTQRIFVVDYGLQQMNSIFRNALCAGIYYDYDISNAQPTILKFILNKSGYNTQLLDEYIKTKDKILYELGELNGSTNWENKQLLLKVINSPYNITKHKNKIIKHQFFKNFDKYIKEAQNYLENQNPDIVKFLKQKNPKEYHSGKLLNYLTTKIESSILMKCNDNFNLDVPIYDGFYSDEIIEISKLDNLFEEYGIKWKIKPIENNIEEIIETIKCKNTIIGDNLKDCGLLYLNTILGDKFIISDGERFLKDGGIWTNNEKIIKKKINYDIIHNGDIYYKEVDSYGNEKFINVDGNPILIKNMIDIIIWNGCEDVPNFMDLIWEKSLYKLVFNNGYYDFYKNVFSEKIEEVESFIKISNDLNLKSDPILRKQIYEKILNPIFTIQDKREDKKDRTKLRDNFLYKMARVLAGHIEDKNWFLFIGLRDSGKGVLMDFIKNCFQKYIRTTESTNFKFERGNGGAKGNSWMVDFIFCRLALISEIPMEDKTSIMDGNKIKKFCSGGDYIEGRKNYKDEIEFRVQSSLMVCCNELPKVNPTDTFEKLIPYDMKSKFINNLEEEFDNEEVSYYQSIPEVKTRFIKDKQVQNEFILMIIDAYKKKQEIPKKFLVEFEGNSLEDDEELKLFSLFQKNHNNRISYNEIKNIITKKQLTITFRTVIKKLKVKYACKTINNNGNNYLLGIERPIDNFLDDEEE